MSTLYQRRAREIGLRLEGNDRVGYCLRYADTGKLCHEHADAFPMFRRLAKIAADQRRRAAEQEKIAQLDRAHELLGAAGAFARVINSHALPPSVLIKADQIVSELWNASRREAEMSRFIPFGDLTHVCIMSKRTAAHDWRRTPSKSRRGT